jgi:hypothetical protein
MFTMPRIDLPRIKTVNLTIAQVKALSGAELLEILNGESEHEGIIPLSLQKIITAELLARDLAKGRVPHWSVLPSFWLLVTAVVLALVGAVAALLALPQVQQRVFAEPVRQPIIPPASTSERGALLAQPPTVEASAIKEGK